MHGFIELDKDCFMEVTDDNKDDIVIYIACVSLNDKKYSWRTQDEYYELRFASRDARDEYCDMLDLEECNGCIDMGRETVWGFNAPYEIDVMYDITYYSESTDF